MEIYDFLMIGVVIGAMIFGAWKGLAWQVASLASLVFSYFVALRFAGHLAPHISDKEPTNVIVAMLMIYAVSSLVIWVIFRMVSGFIDRLKLREFDRQMGALVGVAKGVMLCIAITFFAITLTKNPLRESILTSKSAHYMGYVIDRVHVVMPDKVHGIVHPYLKKLDEELEHDHVEFGHHEEPDHEHHDLLPAAIGGGH